MKTLEQAAREQRKYFEPKYTSTRQFTLIDVANWIEETYLQGAKHGVEFAEAWVSVEEEFPPLGTTLIVKNGDFFVGLGHFDKDHLFYFIGLDDSLIGIKITFTHYRPVYR